MPALLAALEGLFAALPELEKDAHLFADWIKHITGNDPAGFVTKVTASFNKLDAAKTPQDYHDAAVDLQSLLRRG